MSSSAGRRVSVLAILIGIAGVVLVIAGAITWVMVQQQLADENITVSDDARWLAGDKVDGPFSAYAQADIINTHAKDMADGKTYAELPQDDPVRESVMDASFLRASLYTSVVAFGVAALAFGLGIVFILVAWALKATTRRDTRELSGDSAARAPTA
jgi:hypothetical protein